MSEINGQYNINVNDQVIHSVPNDAPNEWESVDVKIASHGGGEYPPTNGEYRNFVYDLCYGGM